MSNRGQSEFQRGDQPVSDARAFLLSPVGRHGRQFRLEHRIEVGNEIVLSYLFHVQMHR